MLSKGARTGSRKSAEVFCVLLSKFTVSPLQTANAKADDSVVCPPAPSAAPFRGAGPATKPKEKAPPSVQQCSGCERQQSMKRFLMRSALLGAAALLLAACSTVQAPQKPAVERPSFTPTTFAALPASAPEDWQNALAAFQNACTKMSTDAAWAIVCANALDTPAEGAQAFFEANFTPWTVSIVKRQGDEILSEKTEGLATGYYEPLLHGSRTKKGANLYPIYGVPDDLLIIDLAELYPSLKGLRLRGKLDGRRVVPYDTRGTIQNRSDLDKYAIAWVDDPVSAFFLQIQGSGRIALDDGTLMRVGFADQNGWKYHSIGSWLVKNGHLRSHELSMQRIRSWAKAHPKDVKEALAQNPSYVFFEERLSDPNLGPEGAQGVPLTPLASVAIDRSKWRLGTPFILSVAQERPDLYFTRPVVGQDVGGAIKGLFRVDYFWGFGDEAGEAAGRQRSRAKLWVLVPNGLTPEDIRP